MGFSKFEILANRIISVRKGYVVWTVRKKQASDTLFWNVGVLRVQIWVLRSNLRSFDCMWCYINRSM